MALALAGTIVVATPDAAPAQGRGPIACGSFYTVVRGDTLHGIASRAYPTPDFLAIYRANRGYMRSPSQIEIGDRLLIPCLDGTGFQTREEALATAAPTIPATPAVPAVPAEQEVPAAGDPALFARILVLTEIAPYAGRRLPEGGMVTELVSRAMLRAPSPVDYEVVFDAPSGGTGDAIGAGGFDLGFPVIRPDCPADATLTAAERRLCDAFVFSDPVVEIERRVYVREGSDLARAADAGALSGQAMCRPPAAAGEFDGIGAVLVDAGRLAECATRLATAEVDAVVVLTADPERAHARLTAGGQAVEVPALRARRTIHVIAPAGNSRGEAFLVTLDRGLGEIRRSGEMAEVVDNHLAE